MRNPENAAGSLSLEILRKFEDTRHCDNRIVTLYCNHRALTTAARVEFGETKNFYESEETRYRAHNFDLRPGGPLGQAAGGHKKIVVHACAQLQYIAEGSAWGSSPRFLRIPGIVTTAS